MRRGMSCWEVCWLSFQRDSRKVDADRVVNQG